MDFYGILFDIKNGSKMPYSKNYFDTLFAAKLEELGVKTLTGTLPLTFRTSETALRSWIIYGIDFQHEESKGTRLPLSFYTDEGKLRDWTIYGNNTPHDRTETGTLPLTFTTHTAGNADDWEIEGNNAVGKNIFEIIPSDQIITETGTLTFATDAESGTITANGTAGSTESNVKQQFTVTSELAGNYYFSGSFNQTGSSSTFDAYMYDKTAHSFIKKWGGTTTSPTIKDTESQEVKLIEGHTVELTIRIFANASVNNLVFKPMVRLPDTSATFEPYTVGVGQRTKNLLEITATSSTSSGVSYVVNKNDGTIIANGTAEGNSTFQWNYELAAGSYVLSGCLSQGSTSTFGLNVSLLDWSQTWWDYGSGAVINLSETTTVRVRVVIYNGVTVNNLVFKPMFRKPDTDAEFIPYGYEIPLTISQTGQTDKTVDIFIGDSPLTEGETVSKQSTGVDLELFEGENTVSTTLYNKPETSITYTDYLGVGEYVNGQWQIPLTVSHITDNIFDKNAKNTNKGYEDSTCIMWAGSIPYPYMTGNEDNNYFVSEKIPCSPNTTYYLTDGIFKNTDNGIYSVFLWNRYRMSDYQAFPTEKTFTTGDDTKFIQLCVLKAYADTVMITTKPTETYIPHVEVSNVNVPIDAPLTASDTATKTSTGVDIPTYVGTNTISTTLENKPEMLVYYGYKGVGEHSGDIWELDFITSANGNQRLTKITMDKPLRAGETLTSEQAGVTIPTYADAENTLSLYPSAAGYGNPEMSITYKGG